MRTLTLTCASLPNPYIHPSACKHTTPLHFSNMRHLLLPTATDTAMSTSSKPKSSSNSNPNPNYSSFLLCKHSPSATFDLLILVLVLFSGTFLVFSYFSYLFHSVSLLLPLHSLQLPLSYLLAFLIFFVSTFLLVNFCCGARSRKCDKPGCKGLKKAMEFDLQLQTEECLKTDSKNFDKLPWKGGTEANPDYECLRSELRKMAPSNGRAVLLFRARCGCPIAKLEGWGPKRGRRHKKALAGVALNGGGDHH